jgi:hypothetical protein
MVYCIQGLAKKMFSLVPSDSSLNTNTYSKAASGLFINRNKQYNRIIIFFYVGGVYSKLAGY